MTEQTEQQEAAEQTTIADIGSVFEGDDADETPAEQVTDNKEESDAGKTEAAETKGDKAETPADEESWTKEAALDERRKRQALEKENKELKEKLAGNQQETEAVVPDPVEDPEGYSRHINSEALKTKIVLSRDIMLSIDAVKVDYEEMETHFIAMTKENPSLIHRMNASPNPAKFAYETAKADKEILKLKDPTYIAELVEKKVQERLAEIGKSAASSKTDTKAEQRKKSAVEVPDLTKATAKGSNSEPGEKLPGLAEMFEE